MAIQCQIIRDNKGEVVRVEAPNGVVSNLYKNLLGIMPQKQALDLWSYSYTEEFRNNELSTHRDENGEHSVETVLQRLKLDYSTTPLTPNEIAEVLVSFPDIELNDLYGMLDGAFYKDGLFSPTEESLATLYSGDEISYILSDINIQENIKQLISKLKNVDVSPMPITLSAETGIIGKYGKVIKQDVDLQQLVGIEDYYEFEDKLKEVSGMIYSDAQVEFLYRLLSNKQRLEVINDQGTSTLINDTYQELSNSLLTNNYNKEVNDIIDVLLLLDDDIFLESTKALETLKSAVLKDYGIDLRDISSMSRSTTATKIFLQNLKDFMMLSTTDVLQVEDVKTFSEIYNEFFDITPQQLFSITDKSDLTLIARDTNKTEEQLFEEESLIKVKDNIYQKVDRDTITEDSFIEAVVDDINILPKEAYYPSAYDTKNNFKADRIKDNEKIRRDINRFLDRKASVLYPNNPIGKEMLMAKYFFGHPIQEQQDINPDVLDIENKEYLAGKFHSDVYTKIAENRGNELYNYILQYLSFDENGIYLNNPNINIKDRLNSLKHDKFFNDLNNYFRMNRRLNKFADTEIAVEDYVDRERLKTMYANNPKILPEYKGKKEIVEGRYAIKNITEDFIRIGEDLFERVGGITNTSLYEIAASSQIENTLIDSKLKDVYIKPNTPITTDEHSGAVKVFKPKSFKETQEELNKCN